MYRANVVASEINGRSGIGMATVCDAMVEQLPAELRSNSVAQFIICSVWKCIVKLIIILYAEVDMAEVGCISKRRS